MSQFVEAYAEFTAPKKFSLKSWVIMKFMRRPFSHVLIRFKDEFGSWKLFHAIGKGVCIMDPPEYIETHNIVASMPMDLVVTPREFRMFCLGAEGMEYSQSGLLMIAAHLGQNFVAQDKTWCSKLVHRVDRLLARKPRLTCKEGECSPGHVFDAYKGAM